MSFVRLSLVLSVALLLLAPALHADDRPNTFVDENGVLRWSETGAELALFGVNYTTPFAHAFRAHQRRGIDWRKAIEADVYHFARLGFDAYRIHVWDREITDADGNLLLNEHMEAFDFLLAELKKRGIKTILTPLQFGNAGYPEPGVPLPGFSSRYGKRGSLEDRTSWPLQERYLAQFMDHVNPHTGLAYKNDPDIIAVEICNEPGHFDHATAVDYINTMARAIRSTGCRQPIFYNMSHGLDVFEAYLDAEVQGGTFQWYPTNLLAQHEQRGNFLPYVEHYPIPFADHPKFRTKAKIVYEFDAADVGKAYLYPAIARTFRTTGFQFATQFAYDPLYIAPFNTEYQTHYLNLAYSPQKALGLKIAAEAFRRIPLGKSFGAYPHNTVFAGIRVNYREDLAELVTDESFFHSNATRSCPPAPDRLAQVAGFGSSPIVTYPGLGAYLLDRIQPGLWRLEVMPDAIQVRDPFEKPHPEKHVVRIAWNEWPMAIDLPDLGEAFAIAGANEGNGFQGRAVNRQFHVRPGVYLLSRDGAGAPPAARTAWRNISLGEFFAPAPSIDRSQVVHRPVPEYSDGAAARISATVATSQPPVKVELVAYLPLDPTSKWTRPAREPHAQPGGGNTPGTGVASSGGAQLFTMQAPAGLDYVVDLPDDQLHPGTLRYHIVVTEQDGTTTTFPSQFKGQPTDWSFHGPAWASRIVAANAPVLLFDAATDAGGVTADHRDVTYERVPAEQPGTTALEVTNRELESGEHDHSFRFFFKDRIAGRAAALATALRLVLHGRSATDAPCPIQVALITADGIAYGQTVQLLPSHGRVEVPLSELRQVRAPNIPHGYPGFIAFWSSIGESVPFDVREVESVLVSIGPGQSEADRESVTGVQIQRIWLE